MIKTKAFVISRENNDYLEFVKTDPAVEHEEDAVRLEKYMNFWFEKEADIEVVMISGPAWIENHLMAYVWYRVNV